MLLKDKIALITGGSRGLGSEIARFFASHGAHVIVTCRTSRNEAQIVKNKIEQSRGRCDIIKANLVNKRSVVLLMECLEKVIGSRSPHILVNNAGAIERKPLLDINASAFNKIHQTNVTIPLLLTQSIAEVMKKNAIRGSIINISSIRSQQIKTGRVSYCCSKSSLDTLTKCSALELAEFDIRVNAIAPGIIEYGMNEEKAKRDPKAWAELKDTIPLKRFGHPKDVNEIALYLASDNSSWMTGNIISIDGGLGLSCESNRNTK